MNPCPPFETLSRELVEPSDGLRQHLGTCAECGRAYSELRALRVAAPALPYQAPTAQEVLRSEDALIRATQRRSKKGSKFLPRAAALVAAGLLGFAVSEGLRPQSQGTPEPIAQEVTTKTQSDKDLVVNKADPAALPVLEQGELTFDLPQLADGNLHWHVVADAQVAGPGARMKATVVGGRLQKLEVLSGQAQLRVAGDDVTVNEGTSWPIEPRASNAELAFVAGQKAWDAGAINEAESAFALAIKSGATGALAEESRYWRVRALLKLGREPEAKSVLQDILRRHPKGRRSASAYLDLAVLAVKAGQTKDARRHLRRVLKFGTKQEKADARAQLRRLN